MAYEERNDRSKEGGYNFAGYQVYDVHYEKIGKVDDLFIDENDQPEYIGVKMGFLGTKSTLIPIELVRVNDKRELVEVTAEKETVKEGPTFGNDREITGEFERRVLNHYGVETRQASTERVPYGAYYPDTTGEGRVDLQPGERAGTREPLSEERPSEGRTSRASGSGAATRGVDRERGRERQGSERRGDMGDTDELRVQRVEEELRAGTREREVGNVNLRKRVRNEREQVRVPKRREEANVERVPVEEGREATGAEIGDDEVRVPIIEEEIVVEKRPVVKEEIRLRKEVVEDEEVVEADVRKEEVDIDDQSTHRDR